MASGPNYDARRGTYSIRWFDGAKWTNKVVFRIPGWKKGMPGPKKVPPAALAALQVYAEMEAAARERGSVAGPASVASFLASYRDAYKLDRAAGSADQLARVVRVFLGWCESAKVVGLAEVKALKCQEYLDWRAGQVSRKTGKPISPVRVELERAMLSGAWARAVRVGAVGENPWTRTEAPGWARERKRAVRKPSWSPAEYERLFAVAPAWLRDILTVGTQTGLRIGALCGIEWRDVEWGTAQGFGKLTVRPELDKAGKGYEVPISRKAHDAIAPREARAKGPFILSGRGGQPLTDGNASKAIINACRRAGLPPPRSPCHHMRRTFGRWAIHGHLTGRPLPLYVVSRWLGHSVVKTTMTYLEVSEAESQDWMSDVR